MILDLQKRIDEANAAAAPVGIKSKDGKEKPYIPVHERIKAFRRVFPLGRIDTKMVKNEDGVCIFVTTISVPASDIFPGEYDPLCYVPIATGTAYEKEGSSNINRLSFVENCESSSAGRALGMAGFGIGASVASADEVQNAELNDISKQKIDAVKQSILADKCEREGVDLRRIVRGFGLKSIEDMSEKQFSDTINGWDIIKRQCGKRVE